MATILQKIVEQTEADLRKRKKKVSLRDFESMECYERSRRNFAAALASGDDVSIIGEIKRASPSKGVIRKDFDPVQHARQYQDGGASALSVLTDEPAFKGSLGYLEAASKEVDIPVLRKDFIVDPYQVKEARAYGADAVLLIVAITEGNQLSELMHAAGEFGIECLVEVYDEGDLNRLDLENISVLGANNRDLHSFEVDLHRGIELLHRAGEDTVLVSESGLSSAENLKLLYDEQIHAALIGEYLMKQPDPGRALAGLKENLTRLIEDNRSNAPVAGDRASKSIKMEDPDTED